MQEPVKTGIKGLDDILNGGIPKGHSVLVAGSSGTGKTILALQFLFEGAKKNEPGVYIALSEPKDKVIRNMSGFTFFDKKLIDSGKVNIIDIVQDTRLKGIKRQNVDAHISLIKTLIEDSKAKRVVIDSLTAIGENLGGGPAVRDFILELGLQLEYLECTTLFISEIPPQKFVYSVFGVEEFIADGIILLSEFERKGELIRALQVIKMRGVDHSRTKYVMKIMKEGVELIPLIKAGIT